MDTGGLAHFSHSNFAMPTAGLASRRGGQNIKPLSFDALKSPTDPNEASVPTPRTSRSHLLAGLRTAPKTAAPSFANNPASPSTHGRGSRGSRSSAGSSGYDNGVSFNGPKTSHPRLADHHPQQQQQQAYNSMMGFGQHYTADQILAPPELHIDENSQEQMDPNLQAQLMVANAYLSEQKQRLQQQLMNLQAAAQQFQGLNLNGQYQAQIQQAYQTLYHQQQQVNNMQPMAMVQPNIYTVYDPVTGQQTLYVDQSQSQQLNNQYANQSQYGNAYLDQQQQQPQQQVRGHSQQQQHQPAVGTPHVQVSPPPPEVNKVSFRNVSPPRRRESPSDTHAPLPPPSANAFRRGHKKSSSLANSNKNSLSIATEEPPKSAGPRTASFPLTPMTAGGSYGPGQARAGEHPVRQPRNPPSMDELKAKPTAKHEGSKNFVTRTRRSAVHNLVRAGLERRKEARSSGSISPISESAEELAEAPIMDNDSDSGRSGSGSLVDAEIDSSLPSSRTSTGSWGAIGSDRPTSRQKAARDSVGSVNSSDSESTRDSGSFASVFKNANRTPKAQTPDGQRKAPMLVLTNTDRRKLAA